MENEEKPQVLPIDEIVKDKKIEPSKYHGKIPVPMGVGRGIGKELQDLFKWQDPRYQPEIDDDDG